MKPRICSLIKEGACVFTFVLVVYCIVAIPQAEEMETSNLFQENTLDDLEGNIDCEFLLDADMSPRQVADALKCKFFYSDDAEGYTYYENESIGLTVACAVGSENLNGTDWDVFTDDSAVSLCDYKVGMDKEEALELAVDNGWIPVGIYGPDESGLYYLDKGEFELVFLWRTICLSQLLIGT